MSISVAVGAAGAFGSSLLVVDEQRIVVANPSWSYLPKRAGKVIFTMDWCDNQ